MNSYWISVTYACNTYAWGWPSKGVETCIDYQLRNKNECWHNSVYIVLLLLKVVVLTDLNKPQTKQIHNKMSVP
jgi:hypothetical protein